MPDLVAAARAAKAAKRRAASTDAMRRLLSTAARTGMAEVDSPAHWQTLFKAQRLGGPF